MSRELSAQDAARVIESAFAPLRCVAEPWDYEYRIRFRVFDADNELLISMDEVLRPVFEDSERLESLLKYARERVEAKGVKLDPWSLSGPPESAT